MEAMRIKRKHGIMLGLVLGSYYLYQHRDDQSLASPTSGANGFIVNGVGECTSRAALCSQVA